jgi:2,4-dichlorophenol 6-monooxygenase
MPMTEPNPLSFTTDVLIVGAGPVGLITSLLLAKVGLTSLVVEKHEALHQAPQAHVISSRSMEICRMAGVNEQRMRDAGTKPEDMSSVRWVKTLTEGELGVFSMLRDTSEIQAMFSQSPTPLCNLSQHLFEPILFDETRTDPVIDVRFEHDWVSYDRTETGYRSSIRQRGTSDQIEIDSRYLIGADGAGSAVRAALGIAMDGPDHLAAFCNIHFTANLRPQLAGREAILYWVMDPEHAGVFIAHDIDNTWVYMKAVEPGTALTDTLDEPACTRLLADAIGGDVDFKIEHIGPWVMTAQIAEHYERDGVFLVGDAAHRFPPTGGIGMNTGFQDAHNLVWKLGMVERGFDARLLSSYEHERRPVAETNSEQSLANHKKMADVARAIGLSKDVAESRRAIAEVLDDSERQRQVQAAIDEQAEHFNMRGLDLGYCYDGTAIITDGAPPRPDNPVMQYRPSTTPGARMPHAWINRSGERCSTLDLLSYDAFTLLHDPRDSDAANLAEALRKDGYPVNAVAVGPSADNEPADETFAVLFDLAEQPLLIRPDGHIAWRARVHADLPDVKDALNRILGHP